MRPAWQACGVAFPPTVHDRVGDFLYTLQAPARYYDVRTTSGETPGNGFTNSPRCAVHNRDFSIQIGLIHEPSPINLLRNLRIPPIQRS